MINEMVSIIIPSYGRPDFLIRAVESTLNQDYKNIEIIVINDNAADSVYFDETNIVLKKFSSDARVKVLATGVNVGGSVARNQGITYSSGEYVTFLDDDDFYFKNKVSRQIEHLNSEKLDVSVCDMFVDDVIKQKKGYGIARVGMLGDFIINGSAFTPMFFFKRNVLDSVGLFTDSPRFQDHILMLKVLRSGFRVGVLHEELFQHTFHNGTGITSEKNFKKGYAIRCIEENKCLNYLNSKQRRKYFLSVYLTNARLHRNDGNNKAAIKYIIHALTMVRDIHDFSKVAKRVASIFLLKTSRS